MVTFLALWDGNCSSITPTSSDTLSAPARLFLRVEPSISPQQAETVGTDGCLSAPVATLTGDWGRCTCTPRSLLQLPVRSRHRAQRWFCVLPVGFSPIGWRRLPFLHVISFTSQINNSFRILDLVSALEEIQRTAHVLSPARTSSALQKATTRLTQPLKLCGQQAFYLSRSLALSASASPQCLFSSLSPSRCLLSSDGSCHLAVNTFAVSHGTSLHCTWKHK